MYSVLWAEPRHCHSSGMKSTPTSLKVKGPYNGKLPIGYCIKLLLHIYEMCQGILDSLWYRLGKENMDGQIISQSFMDKCLKLCITVFYRQSIEWLTIMLSFIKALTITKFLWISETLSTNERFATITMFDFFLFFLILWIV